MRAYFGRLTIAVLILLGPANAAMAERVLALVSVSNQTMRVYYENRLLYQWPVSTAKPGKITPTGRFTPGFLSKNHRSSRYNNAPMPYAIFYDGHYAIHGTDQTDKLGQPASRGCVRLHPDNARILFRMVQSEGMQNMRVVIMQ